MTSSPEGLSTFEFRCIMERKLFVSQVHSTHAGFLNPGSTPGSCICFVIMARARGQPEDQGCDPTGG